MKVLPLDFFFSFFDCSSVGPSDSNWLPFAGVFLPEVVVSLIGSTQAVDMGWEGGEDDIQGCTLNDHYCFFVFFLPLKGFSLPLLLLTYGFCWSIFKFTAQTAIPIASSELWQIKLCLHQTCFLYPQTYLKHFFFNRDTFTLIHCVCLVVACGIRLVKQDFFVKKIVGFFLMLIQTSHFRLMGNLNLLMSLIHPAM